MMLSSSMLRTATSTSAAAPARRRNAAPSARPCRCRRAAGAAARPAAFMEDKDKQDSEKAKKQAQHAGRQAERPGGQAHDDDPRVSSSRSVQELLSRPRRGMAVKEAKRPLEPWSYSPARWGVQRTPALRMHAGGAGQGHLCKQLLLFGQVTLY